MSVAELPTMADVLAQMAEDNPNLAPVVQYLAQQEAARAALDVGEDDPVDAVDTDPDLASITRSDAAMVADVLHHVREELSELRRRNDDLAAAVGACFLCWGASHDCDECGGAGRPGWARPDPMLFGIWVVPAVRRVASQRRRRSPAPHSHTEGVES